MALSSINIVLNAITDAFNRNIKKAADTMDASAKRMGQSADAAGTAIENSLGSGQLRQKIKQVSDTIDEQKNITREFQAELEKLRQKRDTMSKMDIQGQKAVKKEIEATKTALKDQSLAVSQLSATKQQYTQQLGVTNQTMSGSRAALNGLATSFSAVSSVVGIMSDDNKELRNTLMATNAALNFGAAIMQVKDLQAQFGSMSAVFSKVTAFMAANPFMVAAIAIASVVALTAAWLDDSEAIEKAYEAQKKYTDELEKYNSRAIAFVERQLEFRKQEAIKRAQLAGKTESQIQQIELDHMNIRLKALQKMHDQVSDDSEMRLALTQKIQEQENAITLKGLDVQIAVNSEKQRLSEQRKKDKEAEIMAELSIQKIMRSSIAYLEEYRYKVAKKAKEIRESFNPSSMVAGTTLAANVPVLIQVKIDPKSYSQVVQDFDKLTQDIGAAISALGVDIAVGFGEAIGGALAGQKDAMANFGDAIIMALGGFMSTVGKLLITYAIGVEKFKTAFADWRAALAAGIALVAIGATIKTTMSKGPSVPAFADGGIVSGPTLGLMGEYPGARSNPEVIAPLDKLKTLMRNDQSSGYIASTTIQGRDLAIVLERYNKDSRRG